MWLLGDLFTHSDCQRRCAISGPGPVLLFAFLFLFFSFPRIFRGFWALLDHTKTSHEDMMNYERILDHDQPGGRACARPPDRSSIDKARCARGPRRRSASRADETCYIQLGRETRDHFTRLRWIGPGFRTRGLMAYELTNDMDTWTCCSSPCCEEMWTLGFGVVTETTVQPS